MWKSFESVQLAACRYVTDFGVELMSQVCNKKNIVTIKNCAGCPKIFTSLYMNDDVNDIFMNSDFTKILKPENKRTLNSYKLVILNDTNINMIKLLNSQRIEKRPDDVFLLEYEQIVLSQPQNKKKETSNDSQNDFVLNAYEISTVCALFDFRILNNI